MEKLLTLSRNNKSIRRTVYIVSLLLIIYRTYRRNSSKATKPKRKPSNVGPHQQQQQQHKSNELYKILIKKIIPILIPSFKSKEFFLVLLHSFFLVLRTFLSLQVAALDGRIVSALVNKKWYAFLGSLGLWMGLALPATYCNSMLSYFQSRLESAFRSRLTNYIHAKYIGGGLKGNLEGSPDPMASEISSVEPDYSKMYYKIANLDDRIKNAGKFQ
jgi:ATP-binding cassette subfamily D (ALD) long-chain fatty acid import protein